MALLTGHHLVKDDEAAGVDQEERNRPRDKSSAADKEVSTDFGGFPFLHRAKGLSGTYL
jgi:hypothetical protein